MENMDAKLKISITDGILEVEGSESFVLKVYNDFKEKLETTPSPIISKSNPEKPVAAIEKTNSSTKTKTSKSKGAVKPKSTGNLLTSLNLRPSGKKSLKDFIAEYKKPSSEEKILLYVYYLTNELKESNIGLDHIYTCIKENGDKVPSYLKQTVTNVKNRKGWLDTSNYDDLKYTVQGMNHVEHDLEKI